MAELIEFTNNYVNDMVGKAVISIDGPGQSEKDPKQDMEKSSLKLLIFLVTFGKCNGIMVVKNFTLKELSNTLMTFMESECIINNDCAK
nr:hypothetical protein [Bacillus pumilus]